MEFKGTTGKWKTLGVSKNKEWVNIDSEKGIIARAFFGDIEPIVNDYEAKANALLISKAPEMLEMLQKDIEHLEELAMYIPAKFWTEEFRDNWNKEMHEKEQLIQEATEIN